MIEMMKVVVSYKKTSRGGFETVPWKDIQCVGVILRDSAQERDSLKSISAAVLEMHSYIIILVLKLS